MKKHKLIFEGVELAGKSYIIHEIYNFLEKKYNSKRHILDGCHWFNSDIGIFGTENAQKIIEKYVEMAQILKDRNIIFEKLHISDQVYREVDMGDEYNYNLIEKRLLKLGAKIIFCTVEEREEIFEKRLKDRLTLHTHYGRISRNPRDYIKLQKVYSEKIKQTKLPVLTINLTKLPNANVVKEILEWLGENN